MNGNMNQHAAQPLPERDTPFHQFMHSPERLVLPGAEKARTKLLESNPKLQAAVAGKELVKVKAEDMGVEAVDDYTVRISLSESVPYFTELVAHQIFRLVPRKVIEKYGARWTDPANIVTSGAFKLKSWKPYSEVVVERNPMYWDAANVHLDEIHFYVSNDHPTSMNLIKWVRQTLSSTTLCPMPGWMSSVQRRITWMPRRRRLPTFSSM